MRSRSLLSLLRNVPDFFIRSSQEEQVPNPIFFIYRLRHNTLRGTSSFRLIRGLGPCLSTRPAATHASFKWPRSSQECASVEARGEIGTVFRATCARTPGSSEPLLLAVGSNFGQLRSRVHLQLAWGCVSFLSWICVGAACGKLLRVRTPRKSWMIVAQQEGWRWGASRFVESAARQSEKSLNRPLTLRYEIAR